MQELTTAKRDLIARIDKRSQSLKYKKRPVTWLLPDLPDGNKDTLQAANEKIGARLHPAAKLDAAFDDGELTFSIDGFPVVSGIWLDDGEGEFISAQWSSFAASFNVTEKTDGEKLCRLLLKIGETDNGALRKQTVELSKELLGLITEIEQQELKLDQEIYALYGLTEPEVNLIETSSL